MSVLDRIRARANQDVADKQAAAEEARLTKADKDYWPKAERLFKSECEKRYGLDPVITNVRCTYFHHNSKHPEIIEVEWDIRLPGLPPLRLRHSEPRPSVCLMKPRSAGGYPYLVTAKCLADYLEGPDVVGAA